MTAAFRFGQDRNTKRQLSIILKRELTGTNVVRPGVTKGVNVMCLIRGYARQVDMHPVYLGWMQSRV